jgi:hypothetical protein
MKKVALIVLHYRRKDLTEVCLQSLSKLEKKDFSIQIIVVDNLSPEPLGDLKKKYPQVFYLTNNRNLGFAAGNNVGLKFALKQKADFFMLLNNDTQIAGDSLAFLIKAVRDQTGGGIFAPKIYFAPGYEYHQNRYSPSERGRVFWYAGGLIDWDNILTSHRGVDEVDRGQYDKLQETDFASGCAFLVKKEVFEKIGLLDERYFLYLEDVEFCQRAARAGFKTIYVPEAKLYHFNAGSSEVGGALQDYFITRNRLIFGLKYAPARTKFNLAQESIKIGLTGRPWQRRAIRDFYLRKWGKGSWHD